uniref:hypothetical protein n=1 Tax=Algoriphagus sp. TaxID=1872435 RepID=UPI004048ABC2
MRLTYLKSLLIVFIMLSGCSENKTSKSSDGTNEEFYPDGTYCADVTYYNPNTQRQSEYTLNVEVENGTLTKILWSNGGWLDVSHFTSSSVSSSGDCSFTSDKGYQYTVSINGSECLKTDTPEAIEGREGSLTRQQCADLYGASISLFEAFLKDREISADEVIDDKDCELMHEGLATFERLRKLEEKINKGYIQLVFTRTSGLGIVCQTMIVKRYGVLYLLEIAGGNGKIGLTSFNPNSEDWQEIRIQENPEVDRWIVEVARVLRTGSMSELEDSANYFCR